MKRPRCFAIRGSQPAVIANRIDTLCAQRLEQLTNGADGGGIDDRRRLTAQNLGQLRVLLLVVDCSLDLQKQVLPLQTTLNDACVRNAQCRENVGHPVCRSRRSESQHGRIPESRDGVTEFQVGRSEVVAPLTHTLCPPRRAPRRAP